MQVAMSHKVLCVLSPDKALDPEAEARSAQPLMPPCRRRASPASADPSAFPLSASVSGIALPLRLRLAIRFLFPLPLLPLFALAFSSASLPAPAGEPPPNGDPAADTDPDLAAAISLQRAFMKVAAEAAPYVVRISAILRPEPLSPGQRRVNEQFQPNRFENVSEGSGIIVGTGGEVLTNEHVVRGADKIMVELHDRRKFEGKVIGSDMHSDLAVLRITAGGLKPIPLGDSDEIRPGQWVIAVGNPFGLSNTVTVGVVSALNRSFFRGGGDTYYGNLIQTDAAVNRGNSGGALLDLRGRLIGVNTVIFSQTGAYQGVGFAIPVNTIRERLPSLREGREIQYGWLGVEPRDLTPDIAAAFNMRDLSGVFVARVVPDSPAERAGIRRGSVILSVNGKLMASYHDLIGAVEKCPVGREAELDIVAPDGARRKLKVKIGRRMSEVLLAAKPAAYAREEGGGVEEVEMPADRAAFRGMTIRAMDGDEKRRLGVASGLMVIGVKTGSPAARAGLYEGAVIDEIKHGALKAPAHLDDIKGFHAATAGAMGPVAVHTASDGYMVLDDEE